MVPARPAAAPVRWGRAAVAVSAAAGAALVPLDPVLVERWYSRGSYPAIQSVLTSISGAVPLALLDVWIVLAAGLAVRGLWRIGRAPRGGRGRALAGAAVNGVVAVSIVYLAFLACWGLNYRRPPVTARLEFDRARVTDQAVAAAAARAVSALNGLHARAHDELDSQPGDASLRLALAPAFGQAQRALGEEPFARPARPKTSMLSPYLRWASVDGLINPLGLEVIVNPDLLPVERPFVLAHEWGHLAGWARESEASLVAWLTCRAGGSAAQYSGWLSLYWHLRRDVDPDRRAALERQLAAGPRQDLDAIAARLARGQPIVREASWRTYDSFLKANRVPSGVRNYDEVVLLVIGTGTEAADRPRLR